MNSYIHAFGRPIPGLDSRDEIIIRLRDDKQYTWATIADIAGRTRERIRQIYFRAKRRKALFEKGGRFTELSVRAERICDALGLVTRDDILEAIKSGRLSPTTQIRNYGWVTHDELCKFVGLPKQRKVNRQMQLLTTCPHCGGLLF